MGWIFAFSAFDITVMHIVQENIVNQRKSNFKVKSDYNSHS